MFENFAYRGQCYRTESSFYRTKPASFEGYFGGWKQIEFLTQNISDIKKKKLKVLLKCLADDKYLTIRTYCNNILYVHLQTTAVNRILCNKIESTWQF